MKQPAFIKRHPYVVWGSIIIVLFSLFLIGVFVLPFVANTYHWHTSFSSYFRWIMTILFLLQGCNLLASGIIAHKKKRQKDSTAAWYKQSNVIFGIILICASLLMAVLYITEPYTHF